MNILEKIMAERRVALEQAKRECPIDILKELSENRVHHSLRDVLKDSSRINVIAEMKKASPSAGLLRPDYRPAEIGVLYRDSGAAGISVLTEPVHFLGKSEDLSEVRAVVDIPLLRKDFISDIYHVYESAALGADVILLITAVLDPGLMRELYDTAMECGLDVLAEAHTSEEVELILTLESAIIGINSRNLKTLHTDLGTAIGLAGIIPAERLSVAESGIKTRSDIEELKTLHYNGFLVGESIIGSSDPGLVLRALTG